MSDVLKVLKSVLSTAGVGQSDLCYLFEEAMKKFTRRDLTKTDEWKGAAKILEDMVHVLDEERVINSSTKRQIKRRISEMLGQELSE